MACFEWIDQIKLKLTFTGSRKVFFLALLTQSL